MIKEQRKAFIIMIAMFTLSITGCKKDESSTEKWAADVAGTYTGSAESGLTASAPATTVVSATGDKTVSIQITHLNQVFCFDSVTLSSATSFSISEYDGCDALPRTGSGTFNSNNINLNMCCYAGGAYTLIVEGTK